MSKQHPIVVYAGAHKHANALREIVQPCEWMILHPTDMMDVLGMAVFEYPDMIVIEDTPENVDAQEIYMHLRSVGMENILILTDQPHDWDIPFASTVRVLPLNTRMEMLIEVIGDTEVLAF